MVSNIADLFLNEVQLPHVCMYEYRDGDADFQTASLPAKTSWFYLDWLEAMGNISRMEKGWVIFM